MSRIARLALAVAVVLSPRALRAERTEQWLADVRDAPGEGLDPSAVAAGALWAALICAPGRRGARPAHARANGKVNAVVARAAWVGGAAKVVAVAAGVGLASGLGAAALPAGARAAHELATWATSLSGSSADGSVVYARLEDGPPPEKVDLSTLKVVGTIDPATGQITDVGAP